MIKKLLVALSALLLAVTASGCYGIQAFYQHPIPAQTVPGEVARTAEIPVGNFGFFRHWTILNASTGVVGETTQVSGTVLVPTTPWAGNGPRPIIGYAPGTMGLADDCAFSKALAVHKPEDFLVIAPFLYAGYAVAITDYQGSGTPGLPPYTVADVAAKNVLDVLRAAVNLDAAALDPAAPIGLIGYSQGGQAVARAAEIFPMYAPELDIRSAAVGGVPADLTKSSDYVDSGADSDYLGLTVMAAIGLNSAYPELDLASYLTPVGAARLYQAANKCAFQTAVDFAGTDLAEIFVDNPINSPAWYSRVAEQAVGKQTPAVPVMVGHAAFDEVVPMSQAEGLRDDWCARGATVTWERYEQLVHLPASIVHSYRGLAYTTDRIFGEPIVNNYC